MNGGVLAPPAGGRRVEIVFVVAVAENGVIGRAGGMPWHLRSDLRHFRAATMGKPVVMGRKTYASIGKPLPGRTNIVVTRDAAFAAPGIVIARSLPAALESARGDALRRGVGEIAVIGGGDIFAQAMPLADRLLVSWIKLRPEGDSYFPAIDPAVWAEIARVEHPRRAHDDAGYALATYLRRTES